MEKWQYRVIHFVPQMHQESEKVLNELGEEGWELVAVPVTAAGSHGDSSTAILKKRA